MPAQSQIFNKERRNTLVIDSRTQSVIFSPPKSPSHQQINLQRKIKELEDDVKLYEVIILFYFLMKL